MSDGVRNRNNTGGSGSKSSIRSKKPDNSAFKQQRLPAWQPVLTAKSVLPIFFIVGIIFIPIGSLILVASNGVQEVEQMYTDCQAQFTFTTHPPTLADITDVSADEKSCKTIYDEWIETFSSGTAPNGNPPTCICKQNFEIAETMNTPIFAYYRLTNYYQNHRRYVKSRDDTQLLAEKSYISTEADSDCSPYDKIGERPIAPCGAIANSLFNDTFFIRRCGDAGVECTALQPDNIIDPTDANGFNAIKMTGEDIAWKTDKSQKFDPNKETGNETFLSGTERPLNWRTDVHKLGTADDDLTYRHLSGSSGVGFRNEDFIVWMRTAAFPTFRKLYRKIQDNGADLQPGNYELLTYYNYPVHRFGGGKFFVLATTSWIGGKNLFLGWTYAIVGGICLIVMLFLLCISRRNHNRD